jgi:hypothetical protein
MQEDFDDGVADFFDARSGSWQVISNEYSVTPVVGGDGVSTVRVEGGLPAALEVQTTFNADVGSGGRYSDAFVIFDYHSPTDFKFAGAYVGSDKWVIGRRTGTGWYAGASVGEVIDANTDYRLEVVIDAGGEVTLSVGGVAKLTHQLAGPLDDGDVGVGTWNAISRFDDVVIQAYTESAATQTTSHSPTLVAGAASKVSPPSVSEAWTADADWLSSEMATDRLHQPGLRGKAPEVDHWAHCADHVLNEYDAGSDVAGRFEQWAANLEQSGLHTDELSMWPEGWLPVV